MIQPRILPAGESAVSVEFGDAIDPENNTRVRALDHELSRHPFPGLIEAVPTYRSLLVVHDPVQAPPDEVRRHLLHLLSRISDYRPPPAPLKDVPTVYDGEDLGAVAALTGLSPEEVARLHAGSECMVYMLGFTPGFAYMGLLPEALTTPRRPTPRTWVPTGGVAVAGRQTSVYPCSSPSGWHLIGRACLTLFDPGSHPPTFFLPGDRVRFVPVRDVGEPPVIEMALPAVGGEPTFEVLKRRAPQTTVQDPGRPGYQRYGVPVGGAVDVPSLRAANALVGNSPDAAALECTIAGPAILRLLREAVVAITGADLGPVLESNRSETRPILPWRSFRARSGDVIRFTERRAGARAYLAVDGGIDVPPVLGSRATYLTSRLGGYRGRALQPGDVLCTLLPRKGLPGMRSWPEALVPRYSYEATLRAVLGPQDDYFTERGRETLLSAEYTISVSSDRMGCRLEGPRIEHGKANEIVSDGMVLGAVQVPPDGRPIVMLADRATAGGYPKIATVIGPDVPRLAQLMPGGVVRFRAVSLEEAVDAVRHARRAEETAHRGLTSFHSQQE